ncbi:hypothetical protein JCM31271_28040 [Halorubrum trueperi]
MPKRGECIFPLLGKIYVRPSPHVFGFNEALLGYHSVDHSLVDRNVIRIYPIERLEICLQYPVVDG